MMIYLTTLFIAYEIWKFFYSNTFISLLKYEKLLSKTDIKDHIEQWKWLNQNKDLLNEEEKLILEGRNIYMYRVAVKYVIEILYMVYGVVMFWYSPSIAIILLLLSLVSAIGLDKYRGYDKDMILKIDCALTIFLLIQVY